MSKIITIHDREDKIITAFNNDDEIFIGIGHFALSIDSFDAVYLDVKDTKALIDGLTQLIIDFENG